MATLSKRRLKFGWWRCDVEAEILNQRLCPVTATKLPAECETKDDVRHEIDRIDAGLLTLFAERHTYVSRMAQLKQDPREALDKERVEAVIDKVRGRAATLGLDEDQAELVWRVLIDWNINYEKGIISARQQS